VSNQIVLSFAGDTKNLSQSFDTVGKDAERMAEDTAAASERMGERFDHVSGQASLLSGGIGDIGGAMTEAFGEDSMLGAAGAEMERYSAIVMGVVGVSDLLLFATNNLKLATIAKTVSDKAAAASTWLMNAAMAASPIVWVVAGIVALIAVVVLLYNNWDKVSAAWTKGWGMVKSGAQAAWDWIKKIPGWMRDAFDKIGDYVSRPFRAGFNAVSNAWNNTVGKLSWTVPDWVPGLGGATVSAMKLPTFHSGGIVPGNFGQVVPILAMGGERVGAGTYGSAAPNGGAVMAGDALTAVVFKIIRDEVVAQGGDPSSLGLVIA
jgi:hypothetical protein